MKSLIVVYSYHHKNTQKIADAIAEVLGAEVKSPQDAVPEEIQSYDLVGFGSGIDSGKHYARCSNLRKRCRLYRIKGLLSSPQVHFPENAK
jgi:Flavodoxins